MSYQASSWELFVEWSQNHSAVLGMGGVIAGGILNAYLAKAEAERQRQLAKEIIETIVARINEAESKIIYTMEKLNLERLQGQVRGLIMLWDEYDAIPDDKGMLEEIIINSALIQGELEVQIDGVNNNRDNAVRAYALYSTIFPVRIAAMAERKRAFGVDDDADILKRIVEAERRIDLMSAPLHSLGEDQVQIDYPIGPIGSLALGVQCLCQGTLVASGLIISGTIEENCKRLQKEKIHLVEKDHFAYRESIRSLKIGYEKSFS